MDRIKKPIHQRPPLFSKINRKKTEILICLVFFSSFYFIFKLFFFFYLTNLHGITIEMLCRKMVDALGDVQYMALLNVYISVETERWERGPRHYIILCTPRVRCSANVGRHTGPLINNEKRSEWFVKDWSDARRVHCAREEIKALYSVGKRLKFYSIRHSEGERSAKHHHHRLCIYENWLNIFENFVRKLCKCSCCFVFFKSSSLRNPEFLSLNWVRFLLVTFLS
jgi:hypothetical protein